MCRIISRNSGQCAPRKIGTVGSHTWNQVSPRELAPTTVKLVIVTVLTTDRSQTLVSCCLTEWVLLLFLLKVCWYWKTLTELDDMWTPLCQRLGWSPNYSPSPFEKAAWKRLYIDNIVSLKRTINPVSNNSCLLSVMLREF